MRLITPPSTEPLTLAQAKAHLRVDFNADDDYISALITVARQAVENYCRISLLTQTRQSVRNEFRQINYLDYGPVQSIDSIKYIDVLGVEQTLDSAVYKLQRSDDYDYFILAPSQQYPIVGSYESGIAIQYQCGYSSSSDIPKPILQAMLLHIGDLYENREINIMTLRFVSTMAYENLLAPYVRRLF